MIRRWWRAERRTGRGTAGTEAEPEQGALVNRGDAVELRGHLPGNRVAFQRWYADPEIAALLRHDQEPLTAFQSKGYFDTFILPLSARGWCYAIHEQATGRLIGTTALTDVTNRRAGRSALFRIVIGEKDLWGRGFGTEATRLVLEEAFDTHDLDEVRLEVFSHNPRAIAAYARVGFVRTGDHVEWVVRRRLELRVIEMALARADDEERSSDSDDERPTLAGMNGSERSDAADGGPDRARMAPVVGRDDGPAAP